MRTFVFYIVRKEINQKTPKKSKVHLKVFEAVIENGNAINKPLGEFSHYAVMGPGSYTEVKNYLVSINQLDSKYLARPYLMYQPKDKEHFGFSIEKL